MSASDLLLNATPNLRVTLDTEAHTDDSGSADSTAICALLRCHSILTAENLAPASQVQRHDQFDSIFRRKISHIDGPRAVQDFSHIVDTHLADLDYALARAHCRTSTAFAVEQLFLQVQSHPSNGALDNYLENYSVQLWNALMPNHIPDTLIHAILTPVIKSATRLLSTPWVIHSVIIELHNAQPADEAANKIKASIRPWALLRKYPGGQNDYNPFIRNLLYRFGSRSIVFRLLRVTWWPFDKVVAMFLNRVVSNMFLLAPPLAMPVDDGMIEYAKCVRDSLLLQSRYDPGMEEQERLRKEAMGLLPKVLGQSIVKENTFDYFLVNQRLVVAVLDLMLELVKYN